MLNMKQKYSFRAVIENAGGGGAFVRIPLDVEKTFSRKRVPVKATIDGRPYRGLLVRMGGTYHILGVLKEVRQTVGMGDNPAEPHQQGDRDAGAR
jgi:hypothetical protein